MMQDLTLYSQMLAALIALFYYYGNRSPFLKLLTGLLVLTFVVEATGSYLSSIKVKNFSLYHYFELLHFSLIFFMFEGLIKEKKYLKVSKLLLAVLIIFWIVTFFDSGYLFSLIIVGSINVGILIFLYLRELLLSDKIINYKKLLPFWVSVAFIIFYLPSIPFFSFWNSFKNRSLMPILYVLIVLMNIVISFGLIWSSKKEESY